MRTINLLSFLTILFVLITIEQTSAQSFSYQTVLRNTNRQIIVDQDVTFQFTIYKGSDNGELIYSEVHNGHTNQFGLVNLQIGDGLEQNGNFINIPWGEDEFFLEVAIKTQGDDNFLVMGTSQILAVPYALHSETTEWELGDEDRNPLNETITNASLNGTTLAITDAAGTSNIELISLVEDDDPNPTNELIQNITLNGTKLEVTDEGGTTITDLSSLINDADASSTNEIQDLTLELVGNTLKIGDWAGYANLSSFMDSKWSQNGSDIYRYGDVGIGTNTPNAKLDVSNNFVVSNSSGDNKVYASAGSNGYYKSMGSNNKENIIMSSLLSNGVSYYNNGAIGLYNYKGTSLGNDPVPALLYVGTDNKGYLALSGVKSFRMAHPSKPDKEIWYGCIEGPEAAAYERGTGMLQNGEMFIEFSDHFKEVINPETMTLILTPLDASSNGLAVIEKSADGFKVKELQNGTGTYGFDWEVKSIRKGFENFEVIRDAGVINVSKSDQRDVEPKK